MLRGFVKSIDLEDLKECTKNAKYTPQSILVHVQNKYQRYAYHYAIQIYLEQLYCDCDTKLRKRVRSKIPEIMRS